MNRSLYSVASSRRVMMAGGLFALLSVASCTDSSLTPDSRPLSSADSARLGIGKKHGVRATLAASDPGLVLLSADPGFFMGFSQPSPLTFTFAGPVRQVTVIGNGAISCSGDLGTLTGYDVDGNVIGSTSLQLISPPDCGFDDVTFGAAATLITDKIMAKAILSPMSNLAFPVFNLTGHASQDYQVILGRGPAPPATAKVDCGGSVTRVESVHCKVSVEPAQAFAITKLKATGAGYLQEDTKRVEQGPGDTYDWTGIAVINTDVTVSVSITVNGTETALDPVSGHFDVTARQGPEWSGSPLPPTPTPQFTDGDPLPPDPFPTSGSIKSPDGFLGQTPVEWVYPTSVVPGGPNKNILYAKAPISVKSAKIFVHSWLLKGSAFYNAQPISTNVQIGLKPCLRSDIDKIRQATIDHETKHYTEAQAFFQANNPQQVFEAMHGTYDVDNIAIESFQKASDATVNAAFGTALEKKWKTDVDKNSPITIKECTPSKP